MKQMKKLSILLIFVLAISLCGAFPSEVLGAKALKGTLTGTVMDQNGKPVSNTQVYIYQRDWENTDGLGTPDWKTVAGTTLTTKSGQYKISLAAGEYRVLFVPADLDKYAMEAYPNAPIPRLGDTVTIRYGKTTGNISAKLELAGKIEGYLLDTNPDREGQPLANIPVELCHQEYSYINGIQFTTTDQNGRYVFNGLKSYPWQVWVNTEYISTFGTTEPAPAPTYHPDYKNNVKYLLKQITWEPKAGTTVKAETIRLEYNEFPNIVGTLVYYDPQEQMMKPAVGVNVSAQFADDPNNIQDWGSENYEAVSDEDGHFVITGYPQFYGIFVLQAYGMNANQQYYFDEYYDNQQDQWAADQFELQSGIQVDVGEWTLEPME